MPAPQRCIYVCVSTFRNKSFMSLDIRACMHICLCMAITVYVVNIFKSEFYVTSMILKDGFNS